MNFWFNINTGMKCFAVLCAMMVSAAAWGRTVSTGTVVANPGATVSPMRTIVNRPSRSDAADWGSK